MKADIQLYYTKFERRLPMGRWEEMLSGLPEYMRAEIQRYHHWQDQHRALFGKLLLRQGLQETGLPEFMGLEHLQVSEYGRPSLPVPLDFNISHSGQIVLCAIGRGLRLGVDVEAVRELDLGDFGKVMTPSQWEAIHGSENPARTFFRLWALKESVIKANGKGLSLPLNQLETDYRTVVLESEVWHLQELALDPGHPGFLACDQPEFSLSYRKVRF